MANIRIVIPRVLSPQRNKNPDKIFHARKIDRDLERKFWLQIDFLLDDG